ncbi:hypothetical protein G6O69_11150 [Pseudenhygromyxa sp. WMMC2535]|uniref:hypothetical protein n=1 Tax=Pseudenhygromyxa sp. WMMC2535 TaxID=2712867 RepID=UPI001552DAC5|nr:hypothetical protein [Pseudenhygromyxa sp. WMMC2535]NVB38388.1 hypothetical protein [Pseudenhygromyxa sp. WMMC2535]
MRLYACSHRASAKLATVGLSLGLGLAALGALEGDAQASPGVQGPRNIAMGGATRGSSGGTQAALINPAGLSYYQQFSIEGMYQYDLQTRTHGLGVFIADSLNTPRFALALGYIFMRGTPHLLYDDIEGDRSTLEIEHFGHEISGVLSVTAIPNWLYIGIKPQWQYVSMRYLDDEGVARDYRTKHNGFGLDASIGLNILNFARIGVVGYNLVQPLDPARMDGEEVELDGVEVAEEPNYNTSNIRELSDYPRSLGHGLAIFPLGTPNFSLNLDATYDFTSYWESQDHWTRITVNAGGEFVAGPVPIRVGGWWDRRGRGAEDDRGYVSAGLGFIRPAQLGGVGVDASIAFAQQVTGAERAKLDTVLTLNIGIRLRPDL